MVLFYEKKEKKPESKWRRRIKITLWILCLFWIFMWIGLTIVSRIDGQSKALKTGVTDYLQEATGLVAEIGIFNKVAFYPNLVIDIGDLSLSDPVSKEVMIFVGKADFKVSFWDVLFSRKRWERLNAENIEVKPGVITAGALHVDYLALDEKGWDDKPALIIEGRYNGEPFSGRSAMAVEKKAYGRTFFTVVEDGRFLLESSYLRMAAHSDFTADGHARLTIDEFGLPEKVGEGVLVLDRTWGGLRVDVRMKSERSTYQADLLWNKSHLTGTLSFPVWDIADLAVIESFVRLQDEFVLRRRRGAESPDNKELLVDLDVKIEELMIGGKDTGQVSFPVKIESGIMKAGPFQGTISGGTPGGTVVINGAQSPLALTADLSLKGINFQDLQKDLPGAGMASGDGDIRIKLEGSSERFSGLVESLDGEAFFMAGEGRLGSGMINLWGKGLGQMIIPDFSAGDELDLNCMIADFKITDGVAESAPLFIDTKDVTIFGEGVIDLKTWSIDMTLKPKAKNPEILSLSPAVDIDGPLGNPAITPNTLSLGAALGSVFLGTINPVFAVLTMSDIGLSPDHPCYEYIGSPDEQGSAAANPQGAAAQPAATENP